MDARDIIRTLIADSGYSQRQVSQAIGRQHNFVATYISKGQIPGLAVLSEIADACGCDVIVRNRNNGHKWIIDPPDRNIPE